MATAPCAMDLWELRNLTSLPGYRVLETLHTGTRSTVLRAVRQQDGLPVICKLLGQDLATPEDLASFRREYAITRRLRHAEIVEALDCVPHGGGMMMVFRDIGGTSLDVLYDRRTMDVGIFLDMALRVVDALACIHDAGIVHKDINPSNIVWNGPGGQLNVIDFGIASELSREEAGGADSVEGTLAYMAPEQTGRMNRAIDYRADFYALGATFHECLTGRPPFEGRDALELVHCHIARAPLPVHKLNPVVPEALSAIIARLLAKDPEDRYQSTFGLRADLEQCREEWQAQGSVEPFPLGRRDVRPVLRIPQKLYGRTAQFRVLQDAFSRAAAGGHELLLVAGYSGVGKSALVRELHKPVVARHGFFVSGKFEQLKRDIPYAPLIRAFQDLVRQTAAGGVERMEAWRAKLRVALGPNGRLITDAIPEVERLVGEQPPVPDLGPAEAHERFVYVFRNFVGTFAGPEHPLVLFLDDLQWADLASLRLLEGLVADGDLRHLMVVGAYRDTEVDAAHPLRHARDALEKAGVRIQEVTLAGLDEDAVVQLLADTLHSAPDGVRPLAVRLAAKTLGNPFFLGQFLESLERRGLIAFNRVTGAWAWDLAAIERQELEQMAADVVTFVVQRIRELPGETLAVVPAAACIGNGFDLGTLAEVTGHAPADAAVALWPALLAGLVVPLDDAYRYADVGGVEVRVSYRFVHDRVQQAAYSLLGEDEALACHLKVGRALRHGGESGERLFDIANHLNRAAKLMDAAEREDLATLNLRAGEAARASAAHGPAMAYLKAGIGLLPANAWARCYDLALALNVTAADIAAVNGDAGLTQRAAEAVLTRARTDIDRARAHLALIQLHVARQNLPDAVAACRAALLLLGSPVPEKPTMGHVLVEVMKTKVALRGRSEDALVNLPPTADPRLLTIGNALSRALATTYLYDTNLFTIMVLRLVRLSAAHGPQPASCIAYATYGLISCAVFGDIPGGALFGRVALRLLDRLPDTSAARCQTLFVVKLFIEVWHRPVADTLDDLLDAHRIGLETGDLEYAAYCLNNTVAQHVFLGRRLRTVRDTAAEYHAICAKLNQETAIGALKPYRQAIANLLGEAEDPTVFAGPLLVEGVDVADLTARGNLLAVEITYALLAYLNLLFGKLDAARRYAALRRRHADRAAGMVMGLRNAAIGAIIDCAAWDRLSHAERRRAWFGGGRVERQLRKAAQHAPVNFTHLHRLLQAERMRAAGHFDKAWPLYVQAIDAAHGQGYVHDEAFTCERAGGLALRRGDRTTARALLNRARHAYVRWGALAKVQALDVHLVELFGEAVPSDDTEAVAVPSSTHRRRRSTSAGNSTGAHLVDVATVIRTSQALAQDIRLGDLLRALMQIVIANAGASKGYLLLETEGAWRIEAEAAVDRDTLEVLQSRPIDGPEEGGAPVLARSVVEAVVQRQEPVVLDDAAADGDFLHDAYVVSAQPRSVLCLPLRNRNRLVGILYLENHLAAGVFSAERLELLNLLSAQIAMSIENARLYDGLERMNRTLEAQVGERTRELSEQSQLLRATLASMSDGLAAFDAEERLSLWNERAIKLFHIPPELARVGVPHRALMDAVNGSGALLDDMRRSDLVSGPGEVEFADGRVVQVRRNPMPDGGAVQIYLDVTEDRRRERDLREAHEQLRTAHTQLQAAQQQLVQAEKMASLGALVAGVAHEINTPIGIAMTSSSYLADRIGQIDQISKTGKLRRSDFDLFIDEARMSASLMLSNIARAADLVQSFKLVASDQARGDRRRFELKTYLEEVLMSLRPTWHRPGHDVALDCPGGIEMDSYPGVLAQIVTNFITNSIVHGYEEGQRGRFVIVVRPSGPDWVEMVYTDDGRGIPAENRAKIFEPFFTTRRSAGSTGLGLHIVFNLVTGQLGGTIGLDEAAGGGTRFTVRFPMHAPVLPATEAVG